MPEVLDRRRLNRALLARQLLLRRAGTPLPRALERIGGIQAQYAPSMYIGLWSRLEGLEREALTRALERRRVVQGTLMRATIHLVSPGDYWPFAAGIRRARREAWLAYGRDRPSEAEIQAAARRVRRPLKDGPLSAAEIDDVIAAPHGRPSAWRNGVNVWLDLVRVPPAGTWERRRADLYAAADEWLGSGEATVAEGIERLARRYLQGFGPARPPEIADWAGLPPRRLTAALKRLRLRRFRTEDGAELVDLPRAPLPDAETPAPVRFLPTWDASLLVHARRTGILPEEHRPKVFGVKTPQSVPTFLIDGEVAGTWRYEKERIAIEPFGRLDRGTRRELDEEAERLAAFHA